MQTQDSAEVQAVPRTRFKKLLPHLIWVVILALVAGFFLYRALIPRIKYRQATELLEAGQYLDAMVIFQEIYDHEDSAALYATAKWNEGLSQYRLKNYDLAESFFASLTALGHDYPDYVTEGILSHWKAEIRDEAAAPDTHAWILSYLEPYLEDPDFADEIQGAIYRSALDWMEDEDWENADASFQLLGDYKDCPEKREYIRTEQLYRQAEALYQQNAYEDALALLLGTGSHVEAQAFLNSHYKQLLVTLNRDYANPESKDHLFNYVYDEVGLLMEEINESVRTVFTYEDGRIALETMIGDDFSGEITYFYTFHENGQIATEEHRWTRSTGGLCGSDTFYEYDEEGRKISQLLLYNYSMFGGMYRPPDTRTSFQYDEAGRLSATVIETMNFRGEVDPSRSYINVYIYDEDGILTQISKMADLDPAGQPTEITLHFYDEWGTVIRKEYYTIDPDTQEQTLRETIFYTYEWFHIPQN